MFKISDFIPRGNPPCPNGNCPGPVIIVEPNPFKPPVTGAIPPAQAVGTGMDTQVSFSLGTLKEFLPGLSVAVIVLLAVVLWQNRKG